jgi:hypothetical protein
MRTDSEVKDLVKKVVHMHDHGASYSDIGRRFGFSSQYASLLYHQGRDKIAEEIDIPSPIEDKIWAKCGLSEKAYLSTRCNLGNTQQEMANEIGAQQSDINRLLRKHGLCTLKLTY